jgi:hypothetical protein
MTNKGTAMLVMRNFGYLGLHSVVHSKSSLARDRLVDFTREIQLRRRVENENSQGVQNTNVDASVASAWHKDFVAEPTTDGGRNRCDVLEHDQNCDKGTKSEAPLYAQELAPLRLHASPLVRSSTASALKSQRGRGHHVSGDDIEPYFHTTFCNDLLCHPKLLHNCPKGNIVVKVELREVEWIPEYETYVAHLPNGGPAVYNSRRGPSLVQGLYSSCSARGTDPFFLDEFKLRLPLVFDNALSGSTSNRQTAVLFIVYRLSFSTRKKWSRRFRSKKSGRKLDEIVGEVVGESDEADLSGSSCHLIQLSCGYLPIAPKSSIISDGLYDVKMTKIAHYPRTDVIQNGNFDPSCLILADMPGVGDGPKLDSEDLNTDGESVASGPNVGDAASATSGSESLLLVSDISDYSKAKAKARSEPICLQVGPRCCEDNVADNMLRILSSPFSNPLY